MRRSVMLLAGVVLALAAGNASGARLPATQALDASGVGLPFEVASIKTNTSDGDRLLSVGLQPGGRFTARNASLRELVAAAYGTGGRPLQAFRIVGGPEWTDRARFDVEARAEGDARRQVFLAVRALLQDRFKLAIHTEIRQLPVYAVVLVTKDRELGPALRPAVVDCEALRNAGQSPPAPTLGQPPPCALSLGAGLLRGRGMSAGEIALAVSPLVDRVVVDRTGLTGTFDFDLTWASSDLTAPVGSRPERPPAVEAPDAGPSLFTSLREQLGLRLDSQQGPVDVLVIDRAERPMPD